MTDRLFPLLGWLALLFLLPHWLIAASVMLCALQYVGRPAKFPHFVDDVLCR